MNTLTRLAASGMKGEDEADGCVALAVVTPEVVSATDDDVSRLSTGKNTDAAPTAHRAALVPNDSMAANAGVKVGCQGRGLQLPYEPFICLPSSKMVPN